MVSSLLLKVTERSPPYVITTLGKPLDEECISKRHDKNIRYGYKIIGDLN